MVPRVHTVNVRLKINEPFYITPIFDAHIDDAMCDLKALRRMADSRRDLPNHYAIWVGDFCNLVTPPDLKRFRPSVQANGIARRDDWANATTDYVIEQIEKLGLKNLMFSPGNHEDSAMKFHGYDITTVIAHHFKALRGGYSGVLDFRLYVSATQKVVFRLVYHHGAWGGRLAKGYLGAAPFFAQIDDWHLGVYGHSHAVRCDKEVRRRVHEGNLESYEVYIVNCGQWVQSYTDDASITYYAERQGHMPQPRTCPLIKVVPRKWEVGGHKERKQFLRPECTVEL